MESIALNELAELLRALEQTLLTLKATKDPARRRLLVRNMSRLVAEIERNPCHAEMSGQLSEARREWKRRQDLRK